VSLKASLQAFVDFQKELSQKSSVQGKEDSQSANL
jgi:hypothetical protein